MVLDELGVSAAEAGAVVLSTIGMYAALLIVVRLLGQRVLSGLSGFDLVAVMAFGSIIGRASLGDSPRLASGLIALITLVAIQAVVGAVRATRRGSRAVTNRPVLLMVGEQVREDALRRCHVSHAELLMHLRQTGIRRMEDVGAVVFESRGTLSVIRSGEPIDPVVMQGVVAAELLRRPTGTAE